MLDHALGSTDMMTVWKLKLPSQLELITGEFNKVHLVLVPCTSTELLYGIASIRISSNLKP